MAEAVGGAPTAVSGERSGEGRSRVSEGLQRPFEAILIGGGIHGCAAALFLSRKGRSVLVLEKHHPGRHDSGVNSGGVRTLRRHDRAPEYGGQSRAGVA